MDNNNILNSIDNYDWKRDKREEDRMQQELSGRVNRIRSNKMSFANEGMELSVNIPDTIDVQDTFQALG